LGGRWLAGEAETVAGQDTVHSRRGDPHPVEIGAAVGELAMGEIDRSPLLEQLQDRLLFPRQDAVDRVPARHRVVEAAGRSAALPTPGSLPIQLQHTADP
jgi:hypothetical protein